MGPYLQREIPAGKKEHAAFSFVLILGAPSADHHGIFFPLIN